MRRRNTGPNGSTPGWWKTRHQGLLQINQMTDEHLESAIKWIQGVIQDHAPRIQTGNYTRKLLAKLAELQAEARTRHLRIDMSTDPPDPDEFINQPLQKRHPRSTAEPMLIGAGRAERGVEI